MRGIIIAQDSKTENFHNSGAFSHFVTPVYDKPLIFFAIATLMKAGVKDLTIICSELRGREFEALLNEGAGFGVELRIHETSSKTAFTDFILSEEDEFSAQGIVALNGHEVMFGDGIEAALAKAVDSNDGMTLFTQPIAASELNLGTTSGKQQSFAKLANQRSALNDDVLIQAYCFDGTIRQRLKSLEEDGEEPSMSTLKSSYLHTNSVELATWKRGDFWRALTCHESIFETASFIRNLANHQNLHTANLEAIAWEAGWLARKDFQEQILKYGSSNYGHYLRSLLQEENATYSATQIENDFSSIEEA